MKPFQNESESVTIGDLTLENHVDRITLSGDVDLTLDKPGLALAKSLLTQVSAIVEAMTAVESKSALPDKIEIIAPVPAGNLFGMPDPPKAD